MAAYIELTDITSGVVETFQVIDDKMRAHFGVEPSNTEWYCNWYNTVAFSLALGHSWNQVLKDWPSKENIINWLQNNYSPVNYFGR